MCGRARRTRPRRHRCSRDRRALRCGHPPHRESIRGARRRRCECDRALKEATRAMPTIFTRIINGEIPGRFVWSDDRVVAFLTIEPMMPGHTLVVTREEIDHWIEMDPELTAHLFQVAQLIGKAQDAEWHPRRVGVLVVGEE